MVKVSKLSLEYWQIFTFLPSLEFFFVGQLQAKQALDTLRLPPIAIEKLTEALTAPLCACGIDYQTLEFVGDSALKVRLSPFFLSFSILINLLAARYLHPHLPRVPNCRGRYAFPGLLLLFLSSVPYILSSLLTPLPSDRLTRIRMNSVSNAFLRERSLASGLSSFINPHLLRPSTFVPFTTDEATLSPSGVSIVKKIPRRLLQDTVEATLGAAVATGGLEMAIEAGTQLGLCFGGTTPWYERPSAKPLLDVEPKGASKGLKVVEEAMGYEFKTQGALLAQAITHRSYGAGSGVYEREEYLGDGALPFPFPYSLATDLYSPSHPRLLGHFAPLRPLPDFDTSQLDVETSATRQQRRSRPTCDPQAPSP
jgi:endoribonuclease Dicer